ncbi:hypothetical protein ABZU94_34850 [Streptomyces mirabilis]|uniref:hypothetical protein n=1 Tax=Streptomyces sp. NPDC005388 TaxID=3156717 RepID=UPI0033ABC559
MAHTIPLAHALDDSHLSPAAPPPVAPAPVETAALLTAGTARYHHPHYLRVEQTGPDQVRFLFREFTGRETEPSSPLEMYRDPTLTSEQRTMIGHQYMAARVLWSKRRMRVQATPLLKTAALRWSAWTIAHDTMMARFAGFATLPDDRWRSQVLRLLDAHRVARQMAADWDDIAEQLAVVVDDQHSAVDDWSDEMDLAVVAAERGVDIKGWLVDHISAYRATPYDQHDTPLVARLVKTIDEQRARLADVAHLIADHDTGRQLAPHRL